MMLAKNRAKDPSHYLRGGVVPTLRRTAGQPCLPSRPTPRHSTVTPQLRVTGEGHNNKEFGP